MDRNLTAKNSILVTAIVTILIGSHLLWDYTHSGVPSHHILNRGDLPAISNWWGGIILPLVTWFLLYRIRSRKDTSSEQYTRNSLVPIGYRVLGALIFGLIISVSFFMDSDLPGYMMMGTFLLAFFMPLYLSEYLLGYILGTAFSFGVILPLVGGTLLMLIFLFIYKVLRRGILYLLAEKK